MGIEIWGMVFVLGMTALATTITVVIIWQKFETQRAMAALAREEAYQKLAERSVAGLERAADGQQKLVEELSVLRARVDSMEKLLREVQ